MSSTHKYTITFLAFINSWGYWKYFGKIYKNRCWESYIKFVHLARIYVEIDAVRVLPTKWFWSENNINGLRFWITWIQLSNVKYINKQDIYMILVSMHKPILQGEKGPNQNKKFGNSLRNWNLMVKVINMKNYNK